MTDLPYPGLTDRHLLTHRARRNAGTEILLLRLLLAPSSQLTAADLVLQRAVVRRCGYGQAAGPGRGRRQWRLQAGRSLPRRAFRPSPTVDSAVLVVRRR